MQDSQTSSYPLVYFVILNWNQNEMTLECLESLRHQEYPNFKVVLVDNGSTDGSPRIVAEKFPEVIVIENQENLGYSEGNNIGIEYALQQSADYIFLLNNDTEVDTDALKKLVEVAESNPQIGSVGPTMYYADPPDKVWGGDSGIDWKRATVIRDRTQCAKDSLNFEGQEPRETVYIDTCAFLVKRKVLEEVGLMDTRYFINYDDLDLNMRIQNAGYKICFVPLASIWHKVSAAMGLASPATTYYMTRNSLLFFWTHAPGVWRFSAIIVILLRTIRTIGAWTFKSKYHTDVYKRKRDVNLIAIWDFLIGRFGRMQAKVSRICFGE